MTRTWANCRWPSWGAVESETAFLGPHPGGIAGAHALVDAHHSGFHAVGHSPGLFFAEDHSAQTVGTVIGPADGIVNRLKNGSWPPRVRRFLPAP